MSVYSKPTLPLETIKTIIAFVDDSEALQGCALVCRAWAPLSQQQLFRDICIMLEDSYSLHSTPTSRLNAVFKRSPNLAQHVQELEIGYADTITDAQSTSDEQQLLSLVIPTFSHLHRLALLCDGFNSTFFEFDTSLMNALLSIISSPRMRQLEISGWLFRDLPHLLSLTGTSINSSLTTLFLGNIHFGDYPSEVESKREPDPLIVLDTLVVWIPYDEVTAWLNSLDHGLAFRSVHISGIWSDVPWVRRFRGELEELSFSLASSVIPETPNSISIDLGELTHLSKITLEFCKDDWLRFLLHTLPENNTLTTLELLYIPDWGMEWRANAMRFLDNFLTVQRFPHFTTLLFNYQDHEVDFEVEFFQKGLVQLIARGVVYVSSERKGDILLSSEEHE
ncbi:hypothetical protein ONZ45_g14936 [Pleurotus djamor]|nr:hypothetical protein ONZ45_g14936 [Pleurotus djamor]